MTTPLLRRWPIVGVRDAAGAGLGYLAVAASFGALAAHGGLPVSVTIALSGLVYAGAAQFAGLQGLLAHTSLGVVIGVMLLINLRHIPMSLATPEVSNRFRLRDRLALAAGLTDESFALDHAHPNRPLAYYTGLYVACWSSWVAGTALGLSVGADIPTHWVMFALPALFISLAVDVIRHLSSARLVATVAAGVASVLLARLTGPLAIPVAIALLLPAVHVLSPPDGREAKS
jgi:4-azaleucine resistance transporter AzlC